MNKTVSVRWTVLGRGGEKLVIGHRRGGVASVVSTSDYLANRPASRPKAGGGTTVWRGVGQRLDRASRGGGRGLRVLQELRVVDSVRPKPVRLPCFWAKGTCSQVLGKQWACGAQGPNGALGLPQNRLALPQSLRSSSTFSRLWI